MYKKLKRFCDENPKKATYWEFALVGLLAVVIGGGAMMYLGSVVSKAISEQGSAVPAIFGGAFSVLMIQLYEAMRRRDHKKLKLTPALAKDVELAGSIANSAACFGAMLIFLLIALY